MKILLHKKPPITFFLFIGFLLFNSISFGQMVTVSEEIPLHSEDQLYILGAINERLYVMLERPNKKEILVYDNNLEKIRSNVWDFEKKSIKTITVEKIDSFIHHIYYYRDKGHIIVKIRQFDHQLKLLENDTLKVFEGEVFNPRFLVDKSEDESILMITRIDKPKEMYMICFDQRNFSTLWESKIKLGNRMQETYSKTILTNLGTAFFIIDKNPRALLKGNYNLNIVRISKGLETGSSFEIIIENLYSKNNKFVYDNLNSQLVASGYYSEKNNNRNDGYYFLKISAFDLEDRVFNKFPFSADVEQEIISESRDKQKGILDLESKNMIMTKDGGALMVGEITKTFKRYNAGMGRSSRDYGSRNWQDYYNEDIILHSVSKSGEAEWSKVLHKKQFSQDDDGKYSSFFILRNKSALRFYFNDEINISNTISEYIVTADGISDRKSVMSTEYQKLRLRFKDAMQLDGRSFVVPSDMSGKINLVKFTY